MPASCFGSSPYSMQAGIRKPMQTAGRKKEKIYKKCVAYHQAQWKSLRGRGGYPTLLWWQALYPPPLDPASHREPP
jgi:hypothetical protein